MPMTAERAAVGGAFAADAGAQGGVEGVALRAVAPLAGAAVFALVGRGFLHGATLAEGAATKSTKSAKPTSPCGGGTR